MKSILFILSICLSQIAFAQDVPVTWDFKAEKTDNGNYIVTSTATLDDTWAVYSQHTNDEGPRPTVFAYDNVKTIGNTKELSKAIKKYSDLFEVDVIKFKHEAVFSQEVNVKNNASRIVGSVTFMCCNDQQCLPPTTVDFKLEL